jgi:hypothetical protein
LIGQLVDRVVVAHQPEARLRHQLRLDEQLGAGGERQDQHVRDPLADQRKLDVPRRTDRVSAVHAGGLHDIVGDRVQRTVEHEDPAAGSGPERDDREHDGQMAGRDDVGEVPVAGPAQDQRDGAHRRVQQEQPQQHAGRAGQRARNVVGEPDERPRPLRRHAMYDDREHDHEHGQADEPEHQIQRDMLDRRHEAVVLRGMREVRQPGELTRRVGDGEVDRVRHRYHAEQRQEHDISGDEHMARPEPPGAGGRPAPGRGAGRRHVLRVRKRCHCAETV